MALNSTIPNTAWGSVHAYVGVPETGDTMATTLDDLGAIDQDALVIETAEGTKYQLKDINGKLLDELQLEPELTINFTLIKPSEEIRGKFWDVAEQGTGDTRKLRVTSLMKNAKHSFKFANVDAVGSETFEAPYVSISMQATYQANQGYKYQCKATLLKGQAGYLFDIGLVPEPTSTP